MSVFQTEGIGFESRHPHMTTVEGLTRWFDYGIELGATHMIVVVDTFDYDDYPVYVMPGEDARTKADGYGKKSMQRVMEVYNLSMDRARQMNQVRSFNY